MKRTIALLGLVIGFAVVGGLAAGPAGADAPWRDAFHVDETVNINDTVPCSFPLTEHFILDGRVTTLLDQNGDPIRDQVYIHAQAWFTNEDSGFTIYDNDSFIVFAGDSTTFVGTSFNINIPGYGIVVLRAGRLVIDGDGDVTFESGPDSQRATDGEALCDALSL